VEDLATWLSFQLRAHRDPAAPSPVLSAASLRQMHKPRYLAGDGWAEAWGISWCATRQDDVAWIGHSGGLPGYTSTVSHIYDASSTPPTVRYLIVGSRQSARRVEHDRTGRTVAQHGAAHDGRRGSRREQLARRAACHPGTDGGHRHDGRKSGD
jgi:hypothetical protein